VRIVAGTARARITGRTLDGMTRATGPGIGLLALGGVTGTTCAAAGMRPGDLVLYEALSRHRFGLWGLTWFLLAAGLVLLRPRRLVAVLAVVVALPLIYLSFGALLFADDPYTLVERHAAPDGRHDLRVVRVVYFDEMYEVRARSHEGLLSRDVVLWVGNRERSEPPRVRFTSATSAEIVDADGVVYTVTF
jgi:hypothetical protein